MMTLTTDARAAGRVLPVAEWVDPRELRADPYPSYARLRAESPVAWVPSVRKVLLTSFSGCLFGEQHPEIFSSHIEKAAMIRAMGARPMIRKDDPEHAAERKMVNPTLRPKAIGGHWGEIFARNTEASLDRLEEAGGSGRAADLNLDFARPLAAQNLIDLIGFRDLDTETFARWSADFIAGSGNVLDDDEIWLRCDRSREEATAALGELIPYLRTHPDLSLTSHMLEAGADEEVVRANVFLTISGGVNEPQHMVTNIALLLDRHPEQKPNEDADVVAWNPIFQEAVRMYTPIGMVTRETIADSIVEGVAIPSGTQIGLILASANRDAAVFEDPDDFNSARAESRHLGFGSGTHMCAGKWAAESSIGRIAMPALYRRLPNLHVDISREVIWDGFAFRGMTSLPIAW